MTCQIAMLPNRYLKYCLYVPLVLMVHQPPLCAKEWLTTPNLRVGEVYTDNINLTHDKQTALITEVSPGILVNRNTDRMKLNLNYRLQNLFNATNGENHLYHMLNTNSTLQIVNNSVFLNARANISQQNINNTIQSNSNFSDPLNRTNVTTYGISPYWTPHFNGYAFGNVRLNYDQINIGNNSSLNSEITEQVVNLQTDKRLHTNFTGRLSLYNHDESRAANNNVKFQYTEAEARLKVGKRFSIFALVGDSENNYQAVSGGIKNGAYYTIGAQWRPSQQIGIEAGYGVNSYVTLNLLPLRNMSWNTTFRNRGVGTNTGNTWQTDFNFRSKYANVFLNYLEDTSSTQSALLSVYSARNVFQQSQDQIINSASAINGINNNLTSLSNAVYIRKRANVGLNYSSGKSLFGVRGYNERRLFQNSNVGEEVSGVLASWNWQFAHTMSLFISPLWQHMTNFNSSNNRSDIAVGFMRTIPINFDHRGGGMNAYVEYRYSNQTSNLLINNFDENRLTANLQLAF